MSSRVEACQEQPQRSAAAGGRWQPMGMDSTDGARAWTPPPFWSTHPHIAKPTFLAPTQFRSHPPRPVQVRDYFKVRPFRCDGKQLKFCHLQVGLKFKEAITQNFPKQVLSINNSQGSFCSLNNSVDCVRTIFVGCCHQADKYLSRPHCLAHGGRQISQINI